MKVELHCRYGGKLPGDIVDIESEKAKQMILDGFCVAKEEVNEEVSVAKEDDLTERKRKRKVRDVL